MRRPGVPARSFLDDYRDGALADAFGLPAGDTEAALALPRPADRGALVAALAEDQARWGAPAASLASLDRLADDASRAVVTGQQVAWLLGPTYTLSKTVTALRLAARLHREERPVVPVFWMATQDHDVAEMDHAWVLGRDERLHRLSIDVPEGPAVGRARLARAWIDEAVAALRGIDGGGPHLEEVVELLRSAATGAERWSDAFARLMLALFGDRGLVVIDPLTPSVARLGRPLLERELDDPGASTELINRAGDELLGRGWPPQLTRADGATNLFVERPGGPRILLRRGANGSLALDGAKTDAAALRALLDEDPTAVTPAAGLRPVLQDLLLPTAVMVVGPGELRYLAQTRGVYEAHGVAMPLIWPRASATVLQPPVRRILERHGLDWRQVQEDPDAAECELALERHGSADAFRAALAAVEREVGTLVETVDGIDPTLRGSVRRGRHHLERTVLTLREKAASALARQDADTRRQFARLRAHLRPNGGLQERVLSPFSFFLTLGVASVRDAFLELPPEGEHAITF